MASSVLPYHSVNTMSGVKYAKLIEDPDEYAHYIRGAKRPLMVVGPRIIDYDLGGKSALEYAVEIARAADAPIVATAHTPKKLRQMGVEPDSLLDIIEIINYLKDEGWKGVKGEGNHDLVMFFGIRSDLGTQGLSTLKHFAPHLKTMTLCKYYFPNANYSLSNYRKDDKWKEFLDSILTKLQAKEA